MHVREARAALAARMRARRGEIEQAVLTRAYAISDPADVADPHYAYGLRAAVSAAVGYGLAAVESSAERVAPVPVALLAQARLAARNRISVDTVLRRYSAGHSVFVEYLLEEAGGVDFTADEVRPLLLSQAAFLDRLLNAVTTEHARERSAHPVSSAQRRADHVRRLLSGEISSAPQLAYEFDFHHLALVYADASLSASLPELAGSLDRRLLLIEADEAYWWAWLGGRRPFERDELDSLLAGSASRAVAFGEPETGLSGWRLTHQQAAAALPIAEHALSPVRYGEVALLAAALRDDLLATSLHEMYLEPLAAGPDRGRLARATLRAYFAADCNVSSAAAQLGANRHTVASRLRSIEESLGCDLSSCTPELEVALRLEQLESADFARRVQSWRPQRG
jgi:PucR-like helix-turn-helix protein